MPEIRSIYRVAAGRRSEGGEDFIGNLIAALWTSSDDDCWECVSSFERFVAATRDARTAIRIFHETIVARRPNRIAKTRYVLDIPFFITRFTVNAAAFAVRIDVLVIFAKQHFVIVLGYIFAMCPSCIVRYRRALYFKCVCIHMYTNILCMYIYIHTCICIYGHTYILYIIHIYISYIFFYEVSSLLTIP